MNKEKLKNKVKEFSEFENGWDSYGSKSFSSKIINKVSEIIDVLDDNYSDPFISLYCCGIQLEWENGAKYLEINIEEDGNYISYFLSIEEKEEDNTIQDINKINELLKQVLGE
jgi:hypothetical protein